MKYKKKTEEVIQELPSEYFSVISLKRAVWQYLLDHAQVNDEEGNFRFTIYIPSKEIFWKRVKAREDGLYTRNDITSFNDKIHAKRLAIQLLRVENNKYKKYEEKNKLWTSRINNKKMNGNLYEKTLLKISGKLNKLAKKINYKILGIKM